MKLPQESTKIEAVRRFFMGCPLLKNGALNIDYLGSGAVEYTINPTIASSYILKRYTDGTELRQYPFNFMSKEIYSQDTIDQIEASGFYERLQEWIELKDREGDLPEIDGIQSFEVMSPGYLFSADMQAAIYQIQCRITYIKEA